MFTAFHSKNKITLGTVLLLALFAGISLLFWKFKDGQQIACTMEAKLCPDGSYVGRTGPLCEFAQCSGENAESGWITYSDTIQGITFRYPKELTTAYIHTVDWPPKVQIVEGPLTCTEAGEETARAGRTERRMVDNREYCVTLVSEGAAGSVYTQYAYAFPTQGKVSIFTFSLRTVQCRNYDEEEKSRCESEREVFYLDGLVDKIAKTLEIKEETGNNGSIGEFWGSIQGSVLLALHVPWLWILPTRSARISPSRLDSPSLPPTSPVSLRNLVPIKTESSISKFPQANTQFAPL